MTSTPAGEDDEHTGDGKFTCNNQALPMSPAKVRKVSPLYGRKSYEEWLSMGRCVRARGAVPNS